MPQADLPCALEMEAVFSKTASYKYILETVQRKSSQCLSLQGMTESEKPWRKAFNKLLGVWSL